MPDSPLQANTPLQGASQVNAEFDVGYNQRFEASWHWAELVGRVFMGLVVAAGLAGLLGRGPFSHHTQSAPDHALSVDYEPVARYATATQVTLHLHPSPGATSLVVVINAAFLEPMGLQTIDPRPLLETAQAGGLRLTVGVTPSAADTLLRLHLQPTVVGPVGLQASVVGGDTLRWTQVITP